MGLKRAVIAVAAALALVFGLLVPSSSAQDGGEPAPPPLVGNTTVVPFGAFPAIGYLVADFPSGPSACTASLIRDRWVLTAAHCVQAQDAAGDDEHATSVRVYLNLVDANDIFQFPPPPNLETHVATGWIVHGGYDPLAIFDDVAVVRLDTLSAVTPMGLATDTGLVDAPNGSPLPATAFGFGINMCDPGFGNCPAADGRLRTGTTAISSDSDAEGFLGGTLDPVVTAKNLFLLPDVNTNGALCFGDSGGPLLVQQGASDLIAGVNSFIIANTPGFCDADPGGRYLNAVADVVGSNLRDWVNQVIDAPTTTCWGATPTIEGTSFPDKIIGTSVTNVFHGRGSDDLLIGGGASDRLCGGGSDDAIFGDGDVDRIKGNRGDDFVDGGTGPDIIRGNGGSDLIFGWTGGDDIDGGKGPDFIDGEGGPDDLDGGSGGDIVLGGAGRDEIDGGSGPDELRGNAKSDIIRGGTGHDDIFGGKAGDLLIGGKGNDDLQGNSGADDIRGGSGDDDLEGGSGPDDLDGGSGTDSCSGGPGADTTSRCE